MERPEVGRQSCRALYNAAMPFQKGQQVIIKNPGTLVGTVVEARPGDSNEPEERRHYSVHISDERYYVSTDLEAMPPQRPQRFSKEWNEEMQRWLEAGLRWSANNADREAWDQFVESGNKLGFFIPMKK